MDAIESLAVGIADVARHLPTVAADDYIEGELAKFAVQMRRYEGLGQTRAAAALGYEVDAWIRERISIALT